MKIRNKRFKYEYLQNVSILAVGSITAQLISILISPLTTRFFSPEELGVYTAILTAVSLFGPIISLKYDMVIVMTENESEEFDLINLSLILTMLLSTVFSLVYSILFLRNDFNKSGFLVVIVSIFILLLLYGVNNILIAYNNKRSNYKLISTVGILKSFGSNGVIIFAGITHLGSFGLVLSQIIGNSLGITKMSKNLLKSIPNFRNRGIRGIPNVLKKYIDQPKYNATSAMINTSIYSGINIFVKEVYSTASLGLYSLSYRVLGIPFSIISANIAKIYYETASREKKTNGNYKSIFLKTLCLLTIIIVPIMLILGYYSQTIFSFVFGEEWEQAGMYVKFLTPMFTLRLIGESLTTSFIVSFKQKHELFFQMLLLLLEILVFIITYKLRLSVEIFLLLISIIYSVVYTGMIIYMYFLSRLQSSC